MSDGVLSILGLGGLGGCTLRLLGLVRNTGLDGQAMARARSAQENPHPINCEDVETLPTPLCLGSGRRLGWGLGVSQPTFRERL